MADGGFLSSLGPTLFKLVMNVGFGILAVVIMTALFFGSRFVFKWYKKRKSFIIQALIINRDGTFYINQIGKQKGVDGIDKMEFLGNPNETCPVIDPTYIRNKQVILWRYGVSQYAVLPPSMWQKLRPEDFKIEVINLQMKNFAFLEQRAAVSRWAYIKDLMQKYAPYITILMCLIFAGVAIYFLMQTGLTIYNDVVSARVVECSKLIGGGSAPVV